MLLNYLTPFCLSLSLTPPPRRSITTGSVVCIAFGSNDIVSVSVQVFERNVRPIGYSVTSFRIIIRRLDLFIHLLIILVLFDFNVIRRNETDVLVCYAIAQPRNRRI